MQDFQSLYYNFLNPGSYSGPDKFYEFVKTKYPTVKRSEISGFLKSNDPYTLHKQKRKVTSFRRIMVKGIKYQFSMDLVDLSAYSRLNKGYNWILNVIGELSEHHTCDLFNHFSFSIPLSLSVSRLFQ